MPIIADGGGSFDVFDITKQESIQAGIDATPEVSAFGGAAIEGARAGAFGGGIIDGAFREPAPIERPLADREFVGTTPIPTGGEGIVTSPGTISPTPAPTVGTATPTPSPIQELRNLIGLVPRRQAGQPPVRGAAGTTIVQGRRRSALPALLVLIAVGVIGYYYYRRRQKAG